MQSVLSLAPYLLVLGAALLVYFRLQRRGDAHARERRDTARRQGMSEPPTLHPLVNPDRCIGSGGCARACPEQALGVIGGKAELVNAAACIGHGACAAACPVEAIALVFGTRTRGIEIPKVSPDFESNVPGIFIAGELGGMGLIRKAAEQGRQAIATIKTRRSGRADLDVLVVGAGPAGLSAGLSALEGGLRYRIVEQEAGLGGTVYHYPRNKVAMTAPMKLALVGSTRFDEIQKEALLAFWQGVVAKTGLTIQFNEQMLGITPQEGEFLVTTSKGQYHTSSVLLAIGRRGTPRKLGVPGEEQAKVVYRLVDPNQYRGQRVLVVGGGDSALEAAIALAEQEGTEVALSYRGPAFGRVKDKNRVHLAALAQSGRVAILMGSEVERIDTASVTLRSAGLVQTHDNDAVIVCAGGLLPTVLLQQLGIKFDTKYGTP